MKKSKLLSAVLVLCLCFSLLLVMGTGVMAESGTSTSILDQNEKAPANFDESSMQNPYGAKESVPFMFSTQNELLLYYGYNGENWVNAYDTYKTGESMNLRKDNKAGWNSKIAYGSDDGKISMSIKNPDGDTVSTNGFCYVEAVAFDPTGSGREDHVAFIGYCESQIWVWVLNTKTKSYSAPYSLGSTYYQRSWLTGNGGINEWEAINFFAITAGDYNGDGKDTFVVYAPRRSMGLFEFAYNDGSISCKNRTTSAGNATDRKRSQGLLHQVYRDVWSNSSWTDKPRNQLCCDLTTGDFDGDGIEDLGVLSYTQSYDPDNFTCDKWQYAAPELVVKFGGSFFSVENTNDTVRSYVAGKKTTKSENLENVVIVDFENHESMRSPSCSAGDVDNDGMDEIVMAGYTENATLMSYNVKDGEDSSGNPYYKTVEVAGHEDLTSNTLTTGCAEVSRGSLSVATSVYNCGNFTKDGNWKNASSGNTSTDIVCPIAVQCFAPNGVSSDELVFIQGEIVEFIGGEAANVYKEFGSAYTFERSRIIGRNFFPSVAAGNFDGNEAGREQLVYICALEEGTAGQDDYFMFPGIIYGTGYEDSADGKQLGTCSDYDGDRDSGWMIDEKGDNHGEKLNGFVVACDNDNDGVRGRYNTKGYTYTDPSVTAILEAAPYFDDIANLADRVTSAFGDDVVGETTYSNTVSYGKGSSHSDNVSFGVGFAGELEATKVKASLEIGYALEWSHEFETSTETSYTTSFAATAYDQVIVQRTPVIIYYYDVYDEKNKKWVEGDISVAVPGRPVYYQLSIDEYNQFVEDYNARCQEYIDDPDSAYTAKDFVTLHKVDSTVLPMNHYGDPSAYDSQFRNGGSSLSLSPLTLGYNGGSATSEWSYGTTETESVSMAHGFHFSLTVQTGANVIGHGIMAGGYVSLDYMEGKGSYTATTKENGASGTVTNIDGPSLIKSGIPKEVLESYGFTWRFGFWENQLTSAKVKGQYPDPTPVFAYTVTNCTCPPSPPKKLEAKPSLLDGVHSIDLSWQDKSKPEDNVIGYNVYVLEEDENGEDEVYKKINAEIIPKGTCEYVADGLISNTEYNFCVTNVYNSDPYAADPTKVIKESLWSEAAVCSTYKDNFPVTVVYDEEEVAVDMIHVGNLEIQNGDKVIEENLVTVDYSALDGYTITGATLTVTDKVTFEEADYNVFNDEGHIVFVIRGPSEITITAEKIVTESTVTFDVNSKSMGSVSAEVQGVPVSAPGGKITGMPVVFTAEPKDGFIIKEWVIDGDTENAVDAQASNTFDFYPYNKTHHVQAVFTPEADMLKTVNVSYNNGGEIVVSDGENVLEPDASGNITVLRGTELTFMAKPARFCTLSGWSGAFASYGNKTIAISETVLEDLNVGAVFMAPVQYKVEYSVANGIGGTVSCSGGIQSGDYVLPGTEIVFTAKVKDFDPDSENYRFSYWEITTGLDDESTEPETTRVSTKNLTIDCLDSNTRVIAHFVTLNSSKLQIDGPEGFGSVTRDGVALKSGDTIWFDDDLTFTSAKGFESLSNSTDWSSWSGVANTDNFTYSLPDKAYGTFKANFASLPVFSLVLTKDSIDNEGSPESAHGTFTADITRDNRDGEDITVYTDAVEDCGTAQFYRDSDLDVSANPEEGFRAESYEWVINGVEGSGSELPDLTDIQGDVAINVRFSSSGSNVTFAPVDPESEGGYITSAFAGTDNVLANANGFKLSEGSTLDLTAVTAPGYEIDGWYVNDELQDGSEGGAAYTYTGKFRADDTIVVKFRQITYPVTASCANGAVAIEPALTDDMARGGSDLTFTCTPDKGYAVAGWTVNGEALEGETADTLVWTVPNGAAADPAVEEYKVEALVERNEWQVSYSAGEGGDIRAGVDDQAYVAPETEVTFIADPLTGWHVDTWTVNGVVSDVTGNELVLEINEDTVVQVAFTKDTFVVEFGTEGAAGDMTAEINGVAIKNGGVAEYGDTIVFTAIPEGTNMVNLWKEDDVIVSGTEMTSDTDAPLTYTVENVTAPVKVAAEIVDCPVYTITVTAGAHGTASADVETVDRDGTAVITAVPDEYYTFDHWVVNGTDETASGTELILSDIREDITVEALFREEVYFDVTFKIVNDESAISTAKVMLGEKEIYPKEDKSYAVPGASTVTFYAEIPDTLMVESWTVNGEVQDELSGTFTIDRIAGKSDVVLTTKPYQGYIIPGAIDEDYEIDVDDRNPDDTVTDKEIRENGTVTMTFKPGPDYDTIYGLSVNGYDCIEQSGTPVNADSVTSVDNGDGSYTVTVVNVVGPFDVNVVPGYYVKLLDSVNGTATVDKTTAVAGETVTVRTNPAKEYITDAVTVTDRIGAEVPVAKVAPNVYSFIMPASTVTIQPTFKWSFFVDVHEKDWFYDAVCWAASNEITAGTDEIHFTPAGLCTRAQMITFLWRCSGCPDAECEIPFKDVEADSFYWDALLWVTSEGITKGTSDTTFSPNLTVTREQLATFVYRYAAIVDGVTFTQDYSVIAPFADVNEAGEWAEEGLEWCVKNGIISGTGNNMLSPKATATRAQNVTMLYRYFVKE